MTTTTAEDTGLTADQVSARLTQLENQQALLTQALAAALQGNWTGAGSVEAFLYAISPRMQGQVQANPPTYSPPATQ
jgi:hypothetical protein